MVENRPAAGCEVPAGGADSEAAEREPAVEGENHGDAEREQQEVDVRRLGREVLGCDWRLAEHKVIFASPRVRGAAQEDGDERVLVEHVQGYEHRGPDPAGNNVDGGHDLGAAGDFETSDKVGGDDEAGVQHKRD